MVETLPASANDAGLIPGWGVKIPHASQPKKKKTSILKNKKQYCSKFNKYFNSPHQKKNFFFKWRGTADSECRQDFKVFCYKRGRVQ